MPAGSAWSLVSNHFSNCGGICQSFEIAHLIHWQGEDHSAVRLLAFIARLTKSAS
jgi:hypothetical protein